MKKFACGDVVPGCDATFDGSNDDEILAQVAQHASEIHGMTEVPQELVGQVMSRIEIVA
jgi:predicted small metal-binding protein